MLALAGCHSQETSGNALPPPSAGAVVSSQETMVIARACAADVDRLCPGVPPGEGRIRACMKAHVTELSAPCFDAVMGAVAAEREAY
jgi:hypothetical protein